MFISQEGRLLRATITGFDLPCYVTSFNAIQSLSTPFTFQANLIVQGGSHIENLLHKPASIEIRLDSATQTFHGYIVNVTQIPKEFDEQTYALVLKPFLYYLDLQKKRYIFEGLSVIEIVKKLCKTHGFYDVDISKLKQHYLPINYIVQYDETDLAFIQRLFANFGINYYFEFNKDKHQLILFDRVESLSSLGVMRYGDSSSGYSDIYAWQSEHKIMPNRISLQCTNSGISPQIISYTETNTNTFTKLLLSQQYYLHEYYGEADLKRLAKLQLKHWQCMSNCYFAQTKRLKFNPGKYFTLSDFFICQENTDYLISHSEIEAKDHSHKTKSSQVAQSVNGKMSCQLLTDGFALAPILYASKAEGVQYGVITGFKKSASNATRLNETQLRHDWDKKSNQHKKRYRVASTIASKGYGHLMQAREDSRAVLQMIEGNPTQSIVIGGIYDDKHKPPFNPQNTPYHQSIKTQTIKGQSNELTFVDIPGNEKIIQHAAKDHKTIVAGNTNISIGQDYEHKVDGDHNIQAKGDYIHMSQQITLKAGNSQIVMTPDMIKLTAHKINAN